MTNSLISNNSIKNKIHTIRGVQVILDSDLAVLYDVKTSRLNEQVKRNIDRFPKDFMFQLDEKEKDELVAKCDHLESLKFSYQMPYAFTEQGVSMLSGVIRSKKAVEVNIQIMRAFVAMRRFISQNANIFARLDNIEIKQVEYDKKFEQVFDAIENKEIKQGIFFDGQVFDAHKFISDLIRMAKNSIILIDNYVDDSVLTLFTKRKKNVSVTIYTKNISKQLTLDLEKFNSQYEKINIQKFELSHDRFLIIDNTQIYHIGASLKDLGKRWFAISKIDKIALDVIKKLV